MLKQTFVNCRGVFFPKVSNHKNSFHEKWKNTKLFFFLLEELYKKYVQNVDLQNFIHAQIPKISN